MAVDLEQIFGLLAPVISEQVVSSIQQSNASTRVVKAAAGVVADIEDDVVLVQMDDGGVEGAPAQGIIPAIRMTGVAQNDRVRVHFYPAGGAEAHRVEI